jgi:hypothetical protein
MASLSAFLETSLELWPVPFLLLPFESVCLYPSLRLCGEREYGIWNMEVWNMDVEWILDLGFAARISTAVKKNYRI